MTEHKIFAVNSAGRRFKVLIKSGLESV